MLKALELFEKSFLPGVEMPSSAIALSSLSGASAAFAVASLARHPLKDAVPFVLAVVPGLPDADTLIEDLRLVTARTDIQVLEFPPVLEGETASNGVRLRVAAAIGNYLESPYPVAVVAALPALVKNVPNIAAVAAATIRVATGERLGISFGGIVEKMASMGYERQPEIVAPGQFAVRGGVLDVWVPAEEKPYRIEFFDDEVESVRIFDPATQISVSKVDEARILPIELTADGKKGFSRKLTDILPKGCTVVWFEHNAYPEEFKVKNASRVVYTGDPAPRGVPSGKFDVVPIPGLADSGPEIARNPELLEVARGRLRAYIMASEKSGRTVFRFDDLSTGFECETMLVVTKGDTSLVRRRKMRDTASSGGRIVEALDLEPGELVVHVDYGIGRFVDSTEVDVDGKRAEVFTVEYDEGALLHVPVAHVHLLSRYVGVKGAKVKLHRLDGKRWVREKAEAQRAVVDLASSLLDTQARRAVVPGFAYNVKLEGIEDFEAAFPYQATIDQEKAVAEVKRDLASRRPMDRLLCGDAGYGKTEVAMRAAFIAAMNGRQVALLAPTTVLAEQHFETFASRFAGTPVRIEIVSRFQSEDARESTLVRLAKGTTDIVIGTHAILSADVQFHDLGLVIIDEEQRFGVKHKEYFKRMRSTADVLTMSATPIPRTLYLSMTGARDLSLLRTPPRERVAVETRILRDNDAVIATAIRHEIARGGQVYFLYNRVLTIDMMARRLARLVPEARIEVAHGRMSGAELSAKMRKFANGETDVLVCTTIVESGLDIPHANTIIVDRADRFGMADLYQLRGRVGRSSRQGFAYFLIPAEGSVDADARERLTALKKHSGLGAGFNLSMRDLEIRGAGNLLGSQQSGHIAAVGFSLYCQLLQRTIARMRGEDVPILVDVSIDLDFVDLSPGSTDTESGVCLPYDYVEEESQRMAFHKRLAEAADVASVRALRTELADRYGRLPPQALRLVRLTEFRVQCARLGIIGVEVRGKKVIFRKDNSLVPAHVAELRAQSPDRKMSELFGFLVYFKTKGEMK